MESRLFEPFSIERVYCQEVKLFRKFYVESLKASNAKVKRAMDFLFVCSNGWFEGFCRRNRIALRRLTRRLYFFESRVSTD